MLPPIDYATYLHLLQIFNLILIWRRMRRQKSFDTLMFWQQMIQMSMRITLNLINLLNLINIYLRLKRKKKRLYKPHLLLRLLAGYRSTSTARDVWHNLAQNWIHFFWLTGEMPTTLSHLVTELENTFMPHVVCGRNSALTVRNQILPTFIWLRRYPTLSHLSMEFDIPVSCTHRYVHKWLKLLHSYLVPKYITWHTPNQWTRLSTMYPEWPNVVAILDCTPFRISKPKGVMQRMFYRQDRHCFFLNWLVIVDLYGNVVLSRPGFSGRSADATYLSHVNIPMLPPGLQIMADQGFAHRLPVIVLPRANQPQIPRRMRKAFRTRRSMIERCFGILKNTYTCVGTRRFRLRRWIGGLVCNLTAALYNRKKLIFQQLRLQTGRRYMPV